MTPETTGLASMMNPSLESMTKFLKKNSYLLNKLVKFWTGIVYKKVTTALFG